jgi:hypothetical protein
MTRYILRAVCRCSNGTVANIVESWFLGSCTLAGAMAQADRQHWGEFWDEANAFEITDETGRLITWRPFRSQGEAASWRPEPAPESARTHPSPHLRHGRAQRTHPAVALGSHA